MAKPLFLIFLALACFSAQGCRGGSVYSSEAADALPSTGARRSSLIARHDAKDFFGSYSYTKVKCAKENDIVVACRFLQAQFWDLGMLEEVLKDEKFKGHVEEAAMLIGFVASTKEFDASAEFINHCFRKANLTSGVGSASEVEADTIYAADRDVFEIYGLVVGNLEDPFPLGGKLLVRLGRESLVEEVYRVALAVDKQLAGEYLLEKKLPDDECLDIEAEENFEKKFELVEKGVTEGWEAVCTTEFPETRFKQLLAAREIRSKSIIPEHLQRPFLDLFSRDYFPSHLKEFFSKHQLKFNINEESLFLLGILSDRIPVDYLSICAREAGEKSSTSSFLLELRNGFPPLWSPCLSRDSRSSDPSRDVLLPLPPNDAAPP